MKTIGLLGAMMLFLDPDKPIVTCVGDSCKDCPVGERLHCHFSLRDLIHFLLIALPSFLLGGAGIYPASGWMFILWIFLVGAYFGFVEIRVMCSHCPHYAEAGNSLKCWANYGAPKIWQYRPGPMTLAEKVIFLGGFVVVWGYPLFFLIAYYKWFLLIVYLLTVGGFFMTLKTYLCSRCMNFACPLNTVADEVRSAFFKRNPVVAKACGVDAKI